MRPKEHKGGPGLAEEPEAKSQRVPRHPLFSRLEVGTACRKLLRAEQPQAFNHDLSLNKDLSWWIRLFGKGTQPHRMHDLP